MALRDQLAADLRSVLSTNDFGESFTYIPKGGAARTVVGDVVREVVDEDQRMHTSRVEKATVTVSRDPDDATIGGIDRPTKGDKVRFSDGAVFTWQETMSDIDGAAWVLMFKRENLTAQGNTRR